MKKLISLLLLVMSLAGVSKAQENSKSLFVTYMHECTIPQNVYEIKDRNARERIIEALKKKEIPFILCYNDGKCGFAPLSPDNIINNTFIVAGEQSFFIDLMNNTVISTETILDEKYVVSSTLKRCNWDITDEEREILGKKCLKATSKTEDGRIITAWFSGDISIPIGPAEFFYGLPGLVMALDMGNTKYEARVIEYNKPVKDIIAPSNGKKICREDFVKLKEKTYEYYQGELEDGKSGVQVIVM